MLGYISVIMVTMLMIRAIYFKWVIIGGRLYLAMAMRALTDILPSGNRLAMMSCRSAPPLCALAPHPCLPTSSSLHLFVLCFNLRMPCQEQSSAAIPPHNSAPRNTKRRQLGMYNSYTKSVLFFFIFFFLSIFLFFIEL